MKKIIFLILIACSCKAQSSRQKSLHLKVYLQHGYILCFEGTEKAKKEDTLQMETCRDYFQAKHQEYSDSLFINLDWALYGNVMNDFKAFMKILMEEKINIEINPRQPPEPATIVVPTSVKSPLPLDSTHKALFFIVKAGNLVYYKIGHDASDSALVLIKPLNIETIAAVIKQTKKEFQAAGRIFRIFVAGNKEMKYPDFSLLLEAMKKNGENKFQLITID